MWHLQIWYYNHTKMWNYRLTGVCSYRRSLGRKNSTKYHKTFLFIYTSSDPKLLESDTQPMICKRDFEVLWYQRKQNYILICIMFVPYTPSREVRNRYSQLYKKNRGIWRRNAHVRVSPKFNGGEITMLSQKRPPLATMVKSAIDNYFNGIVICWFYIFVS